MKPKLKSLLLLSFAVLALAAVMVMFSGMQPAAASAPAQEAEVEATPAPTKSCGECHPDKLNEWSQSPHAHAFDNPTFQEGWQNMETAGDCLLCHQAAYDAESNSYQAVGVSCEACHGTGSASHPPEGMAARSDEEYCGTCHPTTLGEARLSGHSTENEVSCVNCHNPHSQQVLVENPDDLCKDCHQEDLDMMTAALSQVHLQEDITCSDCHTLDVPHTFLFNFQHEDTTSFFRGFDCSSEIKASEAERVGSSHEVLGSYTVEEMNWPVVHRVSRLDTAMQCSDCHVMDEKMRADFLALGFTKEEIEQLAWDQSKFPAITSKDMAKLVAEPKKNITWIYWVAGVLAILGVFELSIVRRMEAGVSSMRKAGLLERLRNRRSKEKQTNDGEE